MSLADKLKSRSGGPSHLVINALAGSGKTTSLIEGLKYLKGLPTSIEPTVQQLAIWEQLKESSADGSICMVAFNKGIADELKQRIPSGVEAMTMHSFGFRAIKNELDSCRVDKWRSANIISEILQRDTRVLRKNDGDLFNGVQELVALCKMNLVGQEDNRLCDPTKEELDWLVSQYSVEVGTKRKDIYKLVPKVLLRAKDIHADRCIDFNDMIWVPLANSLPMQKYDLLIVDEAQDLNRCQQVLTEKTGRRLVYCGDPNQAIYGFAGADDQSMPRMAQRLSESLRGCCRLSLTVTRRCSHAVVDEAAKIVPDLTAHSGNSEGRVTYSRIDQDAKGDTSDLPYYMPLVEPGDMILCRCNAPLVSQCFKFLRQGKKAEILGRDVGKGLVSLINRMKVDTVPKLVGRLDDWVRSEEQKELEKRNPSDSRIIGLYDKQACITTLAEGTGNIEQLISRIQSIFTDDKNLGTIRLSSIHKAKGLEAEQVFLLMPKEAKVPHPMAKSSWQQQQEINLLYVARTRAITNLVYVL